MSTNILRGRLPTAAVAAAVALVIAVPSGRLEDARALEPGDRITCLACLVVDETGTSLFARSARIPLPNASTTKMMTALVVERAGGLATETTVSVTAAGVPGGKLSLLPGEIWTVEELLQALLLASSNDAAVALAEEVAGSESAFVALMNERAESMGLSDTSFTTSHGLDAPGHASSARDLAALAAEVLRSPVLRTIVGTRETTINSSKRSAELENTNLLLESYPGATGVKTGFTGLAGNVLVASAVRHGRRLIAVAMNSDDAFSDAAALLDIGFARLRRQVLLESRTVTDALVLDGGGATSVVAGAEVRGPQLMASLTFSFQIAPDLSLPLAADQPVGTIIVRDGKGMILDSVPAVSTRSLEALGTDWRTGLVTRILAVAGDLVGE